MWIGLVAMKVWMRPFGGWRMVCQRVRVAPLARARQATDGGVLDHFGNGADGVGVAGAGGGKSWPFDHIDTQLFQLAGDADFSSLSRARALFAIALVVLKMMRRSS